MTSPYEKLIAAQQRITDRAYSPLLAPVSVIVTEVETDSLGNAIVAYGTIGGEGRFAVDALGRSVRVGQAIMAGVPVNNPTGRLEFLGFLASDMAGTGLVRDAPGPPPDYATTWATTEISTSPALIGSYLIVHFLADSVLQYNPMSFIVSYQVDGDADWSDVDVPYIGGEQSVRLPRLLKPGVTVNVHLRARYAYAAVPSEAGEDRSWTAQANTASPGTATGLTASVAVAGRIRLEASGTIPDPANFYGWRYEIATSAGGAGLVTRTVNGPLDYEPPAPGNYYVAVAPVSMSGVLGTRYPGPLTFDGPYAVAAAAAPPDTTAPPAWGAPTLATRQIQLPDGTPQLYLKVTFPAYAYPADYDRTSVRFYDGTTYNFVTVPYAGSPHDPIEIPVPYGTTTVDLKGFDKVGNSPVGYGTSAAVTVAAPGLPGAGAAPTVAQIGLALRVSWAFPTGAEKVELERATDAAGANAVTWILDGSFFVDVFTDQAVALTSYWYRIRGINKAGNGAWSSRTSGTVQPLTGSFLVADSVTATEIAAGTITGNELNANIVLGSIIATAASGTRWEIRGSGVAAPASVIRFIESVAAVDKERVRLQGTGLTVYGDSAQSDIVMQRSTTGRGELVAHGVKISHDGTRPYLSIDLNTDARFKLTGPSVAGWWGQGTFGPLDTLMWTLQNNTNDEPLVMFTGDYNTKQTGIYPDGIGTRYFGESSPPSGLSLRRDSTNLRWGRFPASQVHPGDIGGYFTNYPFGQFYNYTLPSTGGSVSYFAGWEYYATDTNMMTLDFGAYKGQTTSDWSDCRFLWFSRVNQGGANLGSLQLGARGYNPFWALGTGGTSHIFYNGGSSRAETTVNMHVGGALSKTSGSFVIDDPTPGYEGWELRHCFNESPNAGTNFYLYKVAFGPRGDGLIVTDSEGEKVEATIAQDGDAGGKFSVTIPLPDYWPHLNALQSVIAHNTGDGWGRCKARVSEDLTTLTLLAEEGGEYTIDLRGVRKDPAAVSWWGRRGVRKTKAQQWDAGGTLETRAAKLRWREQREASKGIVVRPLGGLISRERFYGNPQPDLDRGSRGADPVVV